MSTPPRFNTFSEVQLLHSALRGRTERDHYMKLLQAANARNTAAEAAARASQERERQLEQQCRQLETNVGCWERMFNRVLSNSKTDEAHFRSQEAAHAKAKKAMEEKIKVLQQHLSAKHAEQRDHLPVTMEKLHIETLQEEVADLLKNQEKMEEELIRTTSSAIETVQHVTAAVLALVAEVENSQAGQMFGRTVTRNITGRKRKRPAEASHEDLKSTNPLEHSKIACYESIQRAEEALVDATRTWKKTQSEAESMLAVGRKAILDKIMGRPEAQE